MSDIYNRHIQRVVDAARLMEKIRQATDLLSEIQWFGNMNELWLRDRSQLNEEFNLWLRELRTLEGEMEDRIREARWKARETVKYEGGGTG